jgi:hypothetical protein
MNTIKKLPLTMAVIAALCPISVLAQEFAGANRRHCGESGG